MIPLKIPRATNASIPLGNQKNVCVEPWLQELFPAVLEAVDGGHDLAELDARRRLEGLADDVEVVDEVAVARFRGPHVEDEPDRSDCVFAGRSVSNGHAVGASFAFSGLMIYSLCVVIGTPKRFSQNNIW